MCKTYLHPFTEQEHALSMVDEGFLVMRPHRLMTVPEQDRDARDNSVAS